MTGTRRYLITWRQRSRRTRSWQTLSRELPLSDDDYRQLTESPQAFMSRLAPDASIITRIDVSEVQGQP